MLWSGLKLATCHQASQAAPKMHLAGAMGPNMPSTTQNIACASNGCKLNTYPLQLGLQVL
ncbi:hypothetical protein E2C01_057595 [Portunus trituberculatus]|uniref:Uncharacterized protein n=1 Tax=Portunus trituberculatus TaxID=210409 RepID=A0A5B7H310_PORTR|nr:hypothetical protein [Portunus trituberculatus]